MVTGGVSSITITGNKFSLGTGCNDPVVNIAAGGSVLFSHNTMDGEGPLCAGSITWGAMVNGVYAANAVLTLEYNLFYNTPQDVTDNRGPNSGAASIVERYNLFYLQGFTGHPDGIQLNGGNFNPIDVSFNTYYNSSPPNTVAGTQPFHIEAQLTAAISNSTVSYNTIVTPGSCNGGQNWPNGCTVNYDIACKSDGTGNSNVNFIGFGNYIDLVWGNHPAGQRGLRHRCDLGCSGAEHRPQHRDTNHALTRQRRMGSDPPIPSGGRRASAFTGKEAIGAGLERDRFRLTHR